jgi:hypothetical protein
MVFLRQSIEFVGIFLFDFASFPVEPLYIVEPCNAASDPAIYYFVPILSCQLGFGGLKADIVPLIQHQTRALFVLQPWRNVTQSSKAIKYVYEE